MTVIRFLLRNWPLKLLALGLAIILYAGMVILQNTQTWPGAVQIVPVHQPDNSFLVSPETMPSVSDIRYIAPADVRLTASSFSATIDLSGVKVAEGESSLVKVRLQVDDTRVQIVDYRPQQIRVELDPIVTSQVSVRVTVGKPPSGLEPGTPVASPDEVNVTGAASLVKKVAYAEAPVTIDASGLDVNKYVPLVARDVNDGLVQNVQLDPVSVNVQIPVGSQLRTVTVPVHPVTTGSPTAGYYISSIEIEPLLVSVRGQANALAKLGTPPVAKTKPISVAGATTDISLDAKLDLPAGVEATSTSTISVVIHFQSPDSSRSVTVGVVPDGARPDRVYRLSTSDVVVTIGGPEAALNALDTASLYATVSVGDLGLGSHTNVNVSIALPPGFKLLAISPPAISVVVEVAPAPSPSSS
jgi:YbbR domain-containing protein